VAALKNRRAVLAAAGEQVRKLTFAGACWINDENVEVET